MIDLHIHTTYSDGADNLIEVLKKAEALKLEVISITDHDNCKAYRELNKINVKQYYSGKIIPGIEIKCSYQGRLIEVLGYKIDTDKMQNWADEYYKDKTKEMLQQKYFDLTYENCVNNGLILPPKQEIAFDAKKDWASLTIYKELVKNEINKTKAEPDLLDDFNTFSKKYCGNKNHFLYIDKTKDYPDLQMVMDKIRECNGLVFMPHLFIYRWTENKKEFIDQLLKDYKVDGIECMHSEFNEDEIKYLIELCEKRGYDKSGGSDYHGVNKPGVKLAFGKDNLNIPREMIKNWED